MIPWAWDLIDKYFSEPSTQALIQEIEKIRQDAKDKKIKFYKQTIWFIIFIYIIIWIWIYYFVNLFWRTERLKSNVIWFVWGPLLWFFWVWQMVQWSILQSKRVTTQLFNNFLRFLIPNAQFFETGRLYKWTAAESELFVNNKKDGISWSSSMINEKYRYSIYIPLLYNENKEVIVSLEWVEITSEKETWSWKNRHVHTERAMLYKIIFKNPKRIIQQSVKLVPNSNSWFKETDNLVVLENQQFEQHFDVYSSDPLETRMILTPNVLDKLAQFMNAQSSPYSFNFINNVFYIKRDMDNNLWITYNNISVNGIKISDSHNQTSIINIDWENSIEENKSMYKAFYNEICSIQYLVDALNVDYFNKVL